jgi:hypothetical protein
VSQPPSRIGLMADHITFRYVFRRYDHVAHQTKDRCDSPRRSSSMRRFFRLYRRRSARSGENTRSR